MIEMLRQASFGCAQDRPFGCAYLPCGHTCAARQCRWHGQDEPWFFDVLPCHPSPYPGECLSGYLLRLAEVNGCASLWSLVRDLFPTFQDPDQLKLLSWEYPLEDWGRLPLRTQLPRAVLKRLTVEPWVEKFRPPPPLTRPSHLSPANYLRGVVNPRLQVCPLCLQEQPYVRLMWRLAPVQVCLHHRCLLQSQCQRCGSPLTVLSSPQRHLHCAVCDADLRTLPVVQTSMEMLEAHQRQQAELQFLLDPDMTLVEEPLADRPKAIGLKFRFVRERAGLTLSDVAERLGISDRVITELEFAERVPLAFCLRYLEVLSWSWPEFAALEVPLEFIRRREELPLLSLRFCPTETLK
jgi:DNA-binding transcriptional regulator YiaG